MAGDDGTGEKTEQPTEKRLRDARRDGDVPKSRDLTQTATTLVWMLLLVGLSGYCADQVGALLEFAWTEVDLTSPNALREIGFSAARTALLLTVLPLGIVGALGMVIEFLQTGAVFAPKRIAPQGSRLSPANGLKRVFSVDNLFEIAKSLLKTLVLTALMIVLLKHYLPDILKLPQAGITAYIGLDRRLLLVFCTWVIAIFAFISIGDRLFQRFAHRKRLKMSKDDVRRERKQEDGDPQLRGQRRRLHRQFSTQNARQAAREATAVIVNPTHIAVAILYEPERTAAPVITARAEGNLAKLMRRDAEEAGVPVIRNVPLARALNFHGEDDEIIPERFFDAVAEVIAWAEQARATRGNPSTRGCNENDPAPPSYP
jgi:type III secretion protein U